MITNNEDFDQDEISEDFDVFVPVIIENMSQLEHFIKFYEDLSETLRAGNHEPEDEFLISRPDLISGGLEFFVGFSFEDGEVNESIEELLHEYNDERQDEHEFEVPDLTGREKSLKVDINNYEDAELPREFEEFFSER